MSSSWPILPETFLDQAAEAEVERWFAVTRSLRALRAAVDVEPGKSLPQAFFEGDLGEGARLIASQAWIGELVPGRPEGKFVSSTHEGVDLHLPLGDEIDLPKLMEKLTRDKEKAEDEAQKLRVRLSNPMFVEKAKPEVVERERSQLAELDDRVGKIAERIAMLGS